MYGRFILEQFGCNGVTETTGKTETLQQHLFSVRELDIALLWAGDYSEQDMQEKLFLPHMPGLCSENLSIIHGPLPDLSPICA